MNQSTQSCSCDSIDVPLWKTDGHMWECPLRKSPTTEEKICEYCRKRLIRREEGFNRQTPAQFKNMRFCDRHCASFWLGNGKKPKSPSLQLSRSNLDQVSEVGATDKFIELVGVVRQWFKDEKMEVSDFVLGRMAVRVKEQLATERQRLLESIDKYIEYEIGIHSSDMRLIDLYIHKLKSSEESQDNGKV